MLFEGLIKQRNLANFMARKIQNKKFRVYSEQKSLYSKSSLEKCVLIELYEEGNPRIRFPVSTYNASYSDRLQNKVQSINKGEILRASINKEDNSSVWKFTQLDCIHALNF